MSRVETVGRGRGARLPAEERRRELATAAAHAFRHQGFHRVTMAGVAATVGVSAPAIYRHFRSKNALLSGALDTGLDDIRAALEGTGEAAADRGVTAALDRLAETALRRPDFWLLLQREVRHLDPEAQRRIRADFRTAIAPVDAALAARRPELDEGGREMLLIAAMAVLATPSVHPTAIPPARLAPLLSAAADTVARVPLRDSGAGAAGIAQRHDPVTGERADAILDAAVSLFHRHGYAAVSLDDIGAAVGIAGPSIYHHFPTKADLLAAACDRVIAHLPEVGDDLDAALRAYVAMAVENRESLGLSVTERLHLPDGAAARLSRATEADASAWSAALGARRPALDPGEARLLVDAARTVVHDVVRIGRLHRRPGVNEDLVALASAVLGIASPG